MAAGGKHTLGYAIEASMCVVGAMFVVRSVELLLHISLAGFGIWPRTARGLPGIAFSPLLHANTAHLAANAVPLFILLVLLFWDRHYRPKLTLALIWLASGLGTWLIGRGGAAGEPMVHLGASSLIFGLVVYLFVAGILMNSWRSAVIALVVVLGFGGILYGVLPQTGPVSWEGHLCGALAGFWSAKRNHA